MLTKHIFVLDEVCDADVGLRASCFPPVFPLGSLSREGVLRGFGLPSVSQVTGDMLTNRSAAL